MSEKLKITNLKKAISLLPMAKNYPPDTIVVAVEKMKYSFEKINKEWHFKF